MQNIIKIKNARFYAYHGVFEEEQNLGGKFDADVDIFQIDDGYQTATGDWLSIDFKKFPHGMKAEADAIHKKGMLAGLWLAPFGAQFTSNILKTHPEWFIKDQKGKLVKCGPNWGGFCALDIEIPEVRDYIKHFFNRIYSFFGTI